MQRSNFLTCVGINYVNSHVDNHTAYIDMHMLHTVCVHILHVVLAFALSLNDTFQMCPHDKYYCSNN